MGTFLFAWNPKHFAWEYFDKQFKELNKTGTVTEWWNCASHRQIKLGDRAFLVKLGQESPRGIMGSGRIVKEPFLSKHYNPEKTNQIYRIEIEFDTLLDYREDIILPLEYIMENVSSTYIWTPRGSGVPVKEDVAIKLEEAWCNYLNGHEVSPLANDALFTEGSARQFTVTAFERDNKARLACLKHYGFNCVVCDFNFQQAYGEIGKNFIHVHHLVPLSTIRQSYNVDPIRDLRPVCANCHAMIHSKKDFYTIEELRELLINTKEKSRYPGVQECDATGA